MTHSGPGWRRHASAGVAVTMLGLTIISAFLLTPSPLLSWFTLLGTGTLGCALTLCAATGAIGRPPLRPWVATAVPIAIGLAGVLWARDQASAFAAWAAMASTLGLGFLVYMAAWLPGARRAVLSGVLISGVVQVGVVLSGSGLTVDGRSVGLAGNANLLGIQLGVIAFVVVLLAESRWRYLVAILLVTVAAAATASRKAAFVYVFLLAAAIGAAASRRVRWRRAPAGALVLALGIGGAWLGSRLPVAPAGLGGGAIMESQFVRRLAAARDLADQSSLERASMLREGMELWAAAPAVGNGLDQFRARSRFATYSHNNFIELLAGVGLLGTVGFYLIHLGGVVAAVARRRTIRRWWLATCAICLAMAWDIALVSYREKAVWVMLGVAIGVACGGWGLNGRQAGIKPESTG